MREATLHRVFLVRAAEEADPHGAELPLSAREEATRAAVEASPDDPEAQLAGRAERLATLLIAQHPRLEALRRPVAFAPDPRWLAGLGFVVGLVADTLGRDRSLNLLAFPLFALLAWNVGVAVLWGLARLRGESDRFAGLAAAWSRLRVRRLHGDFVARVAAGLATRWLAFAAPVVAARHRLALHLGAAGFALGVVTSLYVAGFAFAYAATWESTFLGAEGVARLFGVLLAPAAWLLDAPVPGAEVMGTLRAPGTGPAATWIHRFALTVILFVFVPRLLLAANARRAVTARGEALALDLEAPWCTRILASGRGEGQRVAILPYSTELSGEAGTRVRELAQHLFGNRAVIEPDTAVAYGDELPPLSAGSCILVFGLAQSPEREVHGRFAARLAAEQSARGGQLLVVLDAERYAAVGDETRLAERRRAWRRVLDEVRVVAVDLDLDGDVDGLLADAQAALRGSGDAA